ncbi:MAG: DpnI domain-containing protein [Synergistaceae bacterium]
MDLFFNGELLNEYKSQSQIARVLTESWVKTQMYCPRCGNSTVSNFENNRPVADFYCSKCGSQYELKSKKGVLGNKVVDGAYETMIDRITSNTNPDFFFMSYSEDTYKVNNFIMIPKHFFIPDIIEKRRPLADTARRAGWVGCNILISKIPTQGMIEIICNGNEINKEIVVEKTARAGLLETKDIASRGWLLDTLRCVNLIKSEVFELSDMYNYENLLSLSHPNNKNIKPKIRQQLQLLRDRGYIEFLGMGKYRKIL